MSDSNLYKTDVYEIQNLGYELLNNNYLDDAIRVFKLNIEEYPTLANTYAGCGDALSVKGDTIQALEYFDSALKMDSSFNYAKKRILSLEKK
jgi:tetratricopeptide (TPR) repeat protein